MAESTLEQLTIALRGGGNVLVVTGAGISLASGIPTFRGTDPNAVWHNDVVTKGTLRYFNTNPVESWLWYRQRFDTIKNAVPNAGHAALSELERWCDELDRSILLVTQNVDGLHQKAGSKKIVEVHGSKSLARCSSTGCREGAPRGLTKVEDLDFSRFHASPSEANIPKCWVCGSNMRPHILWFDERYDGHNAYELTRVLRAAKKAKVVVFVGTSFNVGITDMILKSSLAKGAVVFSIDPAGLQPRPKVQVVQEPAETALPRLLDGIGE